MQKDLKIYQGEDRIVTSHDYYKAVESLPPEKRYAFDIQSIDLLTEGFTHGDLVVVSGYTGHGKTSFCQTVAYNLGRKNVPSLWFSYELSGRQFFNKYKGKELPLFYLPRVNKPYDLEWLNDRILEGKIKHGVKIVFIDHLHYITPMLTNQNYNKSDMVGHAMRTLKDIARDNELVVFLMAHTKQPNDQVKPGLGSLRDSSFVAQESDAVYIMNRPTKRGNRDEYEDHGTFTVCKQRHTGVIGKSVKLVMHNKMFFDMINEADERAL